MKGDAIKFMQFMQGADKRFVIPVYQRNYDWKTENCKQLYDDLIKLKTSSRKSHFFGSIVSVYNPDGQFNEHLVIDGQQRLTTISLLLLAMYNLMDRNIVVPLKASLKERIYEEYLVDKWQDEDKKIKLKPVKNDQDAFNKLFDEDSEHIQESNLTVNYMYFYNRIQKQEIMIDDLFDAICRLEIINISLNSEDNPQLIFESLNSTGLALSEGDKIRNFILMGLPSKQQNDFYEMYWNKIEKNTKYEVSLFIRDYLSVKQQLTPAMNKVYFTIKQYVDEEKIEVEDLLKDMLEYAKRYGKLLNATTSDKVIDSCIFRLNRLETTVTRPFFMEVLKLKDEGVLNAAEVGEIFLTTENYLFRRSICELPTNGLNKIFLLLHREIIRYDGTANEYVDKFKYTLLAKKDRSRYPLDEEFINDFSIRAVYQMQGKSKIYIFERFENSGTAEDKDIYAHCDEGTYSIEHIMPQHLTPLWVEDLGEDYEEIHDTWLHRLANLTLTAYNSKYSNNSFEEKKTMQNGFNDSGIRMNTYIAKLNKWTLEEIKKRNDYLMDKALKIWSLPVTSFKPSEKQLDMCTLEDEVNLSGRQIAKFTYKTIEQPVNTWIDMFERVLKILHAEDNSILTKLAYTSDTDVDMSTYVSNNESDLRGALEIEPGIYVEKSTSTETKITLLRKLFKLYNVELSDLIIYLKDENENEEDVAGTRFETRRKYWAFATPFIQEAHKGECFDNIKTSKQNWISGFFGIGGCSISCVANYNGARVEFDIAKSDKDANKKIFDYLYKHKDDIEQKFGTSVSWERSDETKASYIMVYLNDVSIENETDWNQMAKFHAEWSRKFYEVLVIYLKNM